MKQLRFLLLALLFFASPSFAQTTHPAAKHNKVQTKEVTVYVTRTGAKYHNAGCQYLRRSCIPMKLSDAKAAGYTPCSRCNPPR